MQKKSLLKLDIALLIFFPIFSAIISMMIQANYLTSTLLFFGLPALWLSYRTPHVVKRTVLYTLIFAIPFGIVIDYLVSIDGGWFVPHSLFPMILRVIPVEDILFGVLLVYAVIMFFEHFMHHGKHKLLAPAMKYLILLIITTSIIFAFMFFSRPESLILQYAYLWLGIIFLVIPFLIYISEFPRMVSKFVIVGSYFFVVAFLFELVALRLNQWNFPGYNFIGFVQVFGVSFPIEELLFFMVFFAVGTLAWYEFFDDNKS